MGKWTALALESQEFEKSRSTNRQNRQNPREAERSSEKQVLSVLSVRGLPISEVAREAERTEMIGLVNRLADHEGFTAAQRAEPINKAVSDAQAALECFRLLCEDIPVTVAAKDHQVRCADCTN